jgi:selenocysteine lyase/cysteine desulfurase
MALAYLGPRFDDGVPLEETWLGRRDSDDFSGLTEYESAYQSGMARYDMGQRSNPVLLPMTATALKLVLAWRPERIQAYCARLTKRLIATTSSMGLRVEDAAWRGAHLFGLRLPAGGSTHALQSLLAERGVSVSVRGSAVRVAPNVYNAPGDIAALLDVLEQYRASAHGA